MLSRRKQCLRYVFLKPTLGLSRSCFDHVDQKFFESRFVWFIIIVFFISREMPFRDKIMSNILTAQSRPFVSFVSRPDDPQKLPEFQS